MNDERIEESKRKIVDFCRFVFFAWFFQVLFYCFELHFFPVSLLNSLPLVSVCPRGSWRFVLQYPELEGQNLEEEEIVGLPTNKVNIVILTFLHM